MKKLVIGLFVLLILIAVAQVNEASWMGNFIRSIFGGKEKIEKVVPAESQLAKVYDTKTESPTSGDKVISFHSNCPEPLSVSQIVTYGMKNKDVATVQSRLICLGYLKGNADGIYGKLTASAVSLFQRNNGLLGDGAKVDENTLALLGIRLINRTTSSLCAFLGIPNFTPNPINQGQGSVFNWQTHGSPDCVRTIIRDFTDPSNVITTNLTPAMGGSQSFPGPYSSTRNFVVYTTDEIDCSPLGKLPSGDECNWRTIISGVNLVVIPTQVSVCDVDITANPTSVISGNASNLTWTSSNCTRVFLDGVLVSLNNPTGQSTGPLSSTRTYTLTGTNVPGCTTATGSCLSDSDQATVTVTTNPPVACSINTNSFTVPSTTTIASGLSTTVSWSTSVGCRGVVIETNTGGSQYRYEVPSSGTRTFTSSTSLTDNTLDVTLIASDMTNIVSQTKTVQITDLPNPSADQCAFSSLFASPNPTTGTTTLSWSAPSACNKVFITAWTPNNLGEPTHSFVWNPSTWPGVGNFSNSGSFTLSLSKPTTYSFTAQSGGNSASGNTMVLGTKTVDVKKQ